VIHRGLLSLSVTAAVAFGLRLAGVGEVGVWVFDSQVFFFSFTPLKTRLWICVTLLDER
jgi:hypothetical protein